MANDPFLLLMPSYNQAHFIARAVESVLAQDDPDWELWILDNSSDQTPQVMGRFRDPRIHFIHEPERCDPGTCLNRMLALGRGTFFSYVHTDNTLRPNYVSAFRAALGPDPAALAYCNARIVDRDGRPLAVTSRRPPDREDLFSLGTWSAPFAAGTALAAAIGGFPARNVADDLVFFIRSWGRGPRALTREVLLDFRLHPSSRAEAEGELERCQIHSIADEYRRALAEGQAPIEWAARIDAWLSHASALAAQLAPLRAEAAARLRGAGTGWALHAPGAAHAFLLADVPFSAALGPPEGRLGLAGERADARTAVAVATRQGRSRLAEDYRRAGRRTWAPRTPWLDLGFRARWDRGLRAADACSEHRNRALPALAVLHPEPPRRWAVRGRTLGAMGLAAWARTWWRTDPVGWIDPAGSAGDFMGWPVLAELPRDWDAGTDVVLG